MLSIVLQAGSDASGTSDGDVYFGISRHVWAWGIGTGFALAAFIVSSILLVQTWRYNRVPLIRRWVLLVLLLVPVYALFAWLGLVLKNQSPYWDLVYSSYESVAIWAFFEFLTAYLGGRQHTGAILEKKPAKPHLFPFCWVPAWSMHRSFYRYTRLCVVQYIPVQLSTSVITFVTSLTGDYHDGNWAADDFYPWIALAVNVSQLFALYGLLEFYHALSPELQPMRPLYKFLCIKGIVFFTFWQSEILSGVVDTGEIGPTVTYTTSQEEYGLNDFIICIEMLLFALAHWYAFPPREFDDAFTPPPDVLQLSRGDGAKVELAEDAMDERTYQLGERGGLSKDAAPRETQTHDKPSEAAEHTQNGHAGSVEMVTPQRPQMAPPPPPVPDRGYALSMTSTADPSKKAE